MIAGHEIGTPASMVNVWSQEFVNSICTKNVKETKIRKDNFFCLDYFSVISQYSLLYVISITIHNGRLRCVFKVGITKFYLQTLTSWAKMSQIFTGGPQWYHWILPVFYLFLPNIRNLKKKNSHLILKGL